MAKTDTLYMRRPFSWDNEHGKDATPLGNGKTGALVEGGVGEEEIIFNRYDLWHGAKKEEVPCINHVLEEARDAIQRGDYESGNNMMSQALQQAGYTSIPGAPMILGALRMHFGSEALFTGYRRMLHMDRGECEIVYTQKDRHVVRKCFVSRQDDTFYYEYQADKDTDIEIDFQFFNNYSDRSRYALEYFTPHLSKTVEGTEIHYKVKTKELEYGAAIRVFGADVEVKKGKLTIYGSYFRIAVKCFSGKRALSRFRVPEDFDYAKKLREHALRHARLYKSAEIKLATGTNRTNEDLLDEAYETYGSPELIEKMWRFGRYLFVSGTTRDGLPFPLYGLWHSEYNATWCQHVANENVQILYWHINAGGLATLAKPLIHYYSSQMDTFRKTAERVYGCKGIFVGVYTTPANHNLSVFVPVILHFTGVAGWLSQHFYKYYRMTGDVKMLREQILPFMLAAADFYMDFITYDENGKAVLCPSVSPENTPVNLIKPHHKGHPNPAVKNATIEFAIIKELFTNILTLIKETGTHEEYLEPIRDALSRIPEYRINKDGAIQEWIDDEFVDNYSHRHLSHIYPLFPGEEIDEDIQPELYQAFERAVDLRELGAQCNWSLAHSAAIYATLRRPEKVMECLDTLLKGCTLNNLFTLYSDYRNMGVTLLELFPPVQMDANMGFVNAVQKMLFNERCGSIELLPALSERLNKGSVKGFCFNTGRVNFSWNLKKGEFHALITATRDTDIKVKLPTFCENYEVIVSSAEYTLDGRTLNLKAGKGAKITINARL